ncbi:YbaB/EbfC family nucleoid-associated protein [Thermotalea metallivorans]|uniref:Nucleoid-associated protein AN619_04050 n=1 Tax=Thermotalea metallivorans TaxID=520762 RepID=A0A140LAV1_9FIRM|nr:YbaB/EbfC family nucleoid-associated protein [Thermotalea metallivorans]KXG77676.1 Nucleoid-associated protein [Thermotalea metallivorans]
MAKGKFPGIPGNMNNMLKQVQKMQKQMEELQEELYQKEVEASAGGGAVEVKVNGRKEVLSVTIRPEAVDPDDVEMLQDLIVAATNEALRKADEMMTREMSKITGGMNIPGLF